MEPSRVDIQGRVRVRTAATMLSLITFLVLLGILTGEIFGESWDASWKFLLLSGSSIAVFTVSSLFFSWLEKRSLKKPDSSSSP